MMLVLQTISCSGVFQVKIAKDGKEVTDSISLAQREMFLNRPSV